MTASRLQRFWLALVLNVVLVVGELIAARFAHSSALVADVGHNLGDLGVLVLGLVAARLTARQPTATRSFGFHRVSILVGMANLAIITVIASLITVVGVSRLAHPPAVHGGIVASVAGAAIILNGTAALLLLGTRDLGTRVILLHLASDALASVGVLIAGIVIVITGRFSILDPIASLAIAALIAIGGWRLARETIDVLLESTPSDLDAAELVAAISAQPGVTEVHDLHCWSLSTEIRALSAHVLLDGEPTLEAAQQVGKTIKQRLWAEFGIAHATLEMECGPCNADGEFACTFEISSETSHSR